MHSTRKIKEDLIYVGGSDRRLSRFENLFPIPRGVSYNSYVLLDDKTVLMDTADESISRQYIENVVHALDGRSLDYMIVQHMEPDHAANIENFMNAYPDTTIVANTKTQFPEGAIACEGRISVIEKATVLVEEVDDDNNSLGVTDEFEKVFPDVPYTFDWFLGDSSAFATLDGKLGLTDILRSYRDELKGSEASADGLIRYCEENYKEEVTRQLKELLLGDVDNEPRLVIGGEYGKAEFRWTEKVVAIPYLPDDHEDEKGRIWLFCNEPHELTMEAAPAPTLLAGFPDKWRWQRWQRWQWRR